MKHSILHLAVFILLLLLPSCLSEKGATRKDYVEGGFAYAKEVLHNSSPEEQYNLWLIKLDDTLASSNLTDDEKSVIKTLKDKLTPDMYRDDLSEDEQKQIEQANDSIEVVLINNYNWNEAKLFKYLGTILTEEEYNQCVKLHGVDSILQP